MEIPRQQGEMDEPQIKILDLFLETIWPLDKRTDSVFGLITHHFVCIIYHICIYHIFNSLPFAVFFI